ncbi:MAG: 16S rRNA (cytosine(1402)-N(4))-methyltransferase RsmH [Thermoleophilaceae bacterium]|nr:16S rRNA (cytosine(1402)-N(4))-methyltransferase RsmH [Thermoleophilaceae bacterium]
MATGHVPVLAAEVIELTAAQPGEVVVDATFGGGGHARLFASRIGPDGELIGIDRDPEAEARFAEFAGEAGIETRFVGQDFGGGLRTLRDSGMQADVILLDLGVSSFQLDTLERGFSYVYDAELDMRMDPDQELSAAVVVNEWEEQRLRDIFARLGEERYAGKIARAIVRRREEQPFERTGDLVETIKAAVPTPARFAAGHPAKRVFQALRIAVNDELGQLDDALPLAWDLLAVGGRLAVVSFHSLEDRRVKRFFAGLATGCICPPEFPICQCGHEPEADLASRRAIAPTEAEVEANPRARSGRLRVATKLAAKGEAA